jgi:hypothetical protein
VLFMRGVRYSKFDVVYIYAGPHGGGVVVML